jgi:hypothetical protein
MRQLRRLKWFWQRLTRGFADCDMWSLDQHLAQIILPHMKHFRAWNLHGYPADFDTAEAWYAAVDEMIWGLEWMLDDDAGMFGYRDTWQEDSERAQRGLELFGKYFMALWD